MKTPFWGDPSRRYRSKLVVRFARLWCALLLTVTLSFLTEGIWLWSRGVRYRPRTSLLRVWVRDVSISRNGKWVVACVGFRRNSKSEGTWNDVIIIDRTRDHARKLQVVHLDPACAAIHPEANAVALGCADGQVHRASVRPGCGVVKLERFARCDDVGLSRLVFSPDGRFLSARGVECVWIWRWPAGDLLQRRPHGGHAPNVLSFSADSRQILSTNASGQLCAWDVRSGKNVTVLAAHEGYITNAAWQSTSCWVAVRTTSRVCVHRLESGEEQWEKPCWSSGNAIDAWGGLFASVGLREGDDRILIYDLASGHQRFSLGRQESPITGLRFADNGLLFSWDRAGHIWAWRLAEQQQAWSFSLHDWAAVKRRYW